MANKKKSSVKLVLGPQALRPRKASKLAKKNRATRKVARSILAGSIPRPFMDVKSMSDGGLLVSGVEVVSEIPVSESPQTQNWQLNPTMAALFPRLSTLSLNFERFRFRSVQIQYHTAAPATRSGSVGLAIATDPLDQCPVDFVNLANYKHSCVGSAAESLSTPTWETKDPEQFFLRPQSRTDEKSLATQNALKVFQAGLMVLTNHASSLDDGTIGGYLAIRYTCELISPCAAVQRCLYEDCGGYFGVNSLVTPAEGSSVWPLIDVSRITTGQSVGAFPVDTMENALGYDATVKAWGVGDLDHNRGILSNIDPGTYRLTIVQDLGAETAFPSPVPELADFNYIRVPLVRASDEKISVGDAPLVGVKEAYFDPNVVIDPPSGWQPFPPEIALIKNVNDRRRALRARSLAPLAAGDYLQEVWGWSSYLKAAIQIMHVVYGAGTSATAGVGTQIGMSIADAISLWVTGVPYTAEKQRLATHNRVTVTNLTP